MIEKDIDRYPHLKDLIDTIETTLPPLKEVTAIAKDTSNGLTKDERGIAALGARLGLLNITRERDEILNVLRGIIDPPDDVLNNQRNSNWLDEAHVLGEDKYGKWENIMWTDEVSQWAKRVNNHDIEEEDMITLSTNELRPFLKIDDQQVLISPNQAWVFVPLPIFGDDEDSAEQLAHLCGTPLGSFYPDGAMLDFQVPLLMPDGRLQYHVMAPRTYIEGGTERDSGRMEEKIQSFLAEADTALNTGIEELFEQIFGPKDPDPRRLLN